jgi:hypothetical protein
MSLTLTHAGTSVELDPDLYWADEYQWQAVEQSVSFSLKGALLVQQGTKLAGRPITLQPVDDSSAWLTRSAVDQLKAWADTPLLTLSLAGLRGATRSVMFRQQDGALDSRPVVHFSDVDGSDNYLVTLRLMEI